MWMSRVRKRRAQGDRGAALVEAAFITPVFALLIFGMLEFGLTFRDYLTVANVSRDSARGASAFGDGLYADYNIIQVALQSSKGFRPNEIRRLIVFNAGSVSGDITNPSHPASPWPSPRSGARRPRISIASGAPRAERPAPRGHRTTSASTSRPAMTSSPGCSVRACT